jgi:hypothetical protein
MEHAVIFHAIVVVVLVVDVGSSKLDFARRKLKEKGEAR